MFNITMAKILISEISLKMNLIIIFLKTDGGIGQPMWLQKKEMILYYNSRITVTRLVWGWGMRHKFRSEERR